MLTALLKKNKRTLLTSRSERITNDTRLMIPVRDTLLKKTTLLNRLYSYSLNMRKELILNGKRGDNIVSNIGNRICE